jgi:hypothetical protein
MPNLSEHSGRVIPFVIEPDGRIISFFRIEEQELIALMDCEHEILLFQAEICIRLLEQLLGLQTQAAKVGEKKIGARENRAGGLAHSQEKLSVGRRKRHARLFFQSFDVLVSASQNLRRLGQPASMSRVTARSTKGLFFVMEKFGM